MTTFDIKYSKNILCYFMRMAELLLFKTIDTVYCLKLTTVNSRYNEQLRTCLKIVLFA